MIGWSIASHLVDIKPEARVVVLERQPRCGMGSTGRAAGGVRAQFGTRANVELSVRSIREFESFQRLTGVDCGFRQCGYLFVTAEGSRLAQMQDLVAVQRDLDVPSRLLDLEQIQQLVPILNVRDLVGGTFSSSDGFLDPFSVCVGYERKARASGVDAEYGAEVTSLGGRVVEYCQNSQTHSLEADVFVLATGHWSASNAGNLGYDLPIHPSLHQLAMTERCPGLPGELPMVVDADTTFHFRREGEGLLIGFDGGEVEASRDPFEEDPPKFSDRFLEALAAPALHRLPLLEAVGFATDRSWTGYYADTPDKHGIIGWIDDGVLAAVGFGGHGVMHSPAVGAAAAEMALGRNSSFSHIDCFSPHRFKEGKLNVEPLII